MAIGKDLIFRFNHTDQADELFGNLTAEEIKQSFDSRGEDLKNYLYGVVDKLALEGGKHVSVEYNNNVITVQEAIDMVYTNKTPYSVVGNIGDIIFENTNGYEYEIISR